MHIKPINLLQANEAARWDLFVQHQTNATGYHFSAWVKAVNQCYGHRIVSVIAEVDQQIVGACAVIAIKKPLGNTEYCALPYCDVGHTLSDDERATAAINDYLLNMAKAEHADRFSYRDINTLPNSEASGKVVMKLPLAPDSQAQMASYKSKLRSQIRKAEKNGLTFARGHLDLVDDFYDVYSHNMRDLGSPPHPKRWFTAILTQYATRASVGVVYNGEIAIGAGLLLFHPRLCTIPWASTKQAYNHLAPNMLLYGNLLGVAADSGCAQFDFGRSTVNEGTFRFKKQWGAQPYPLLWSDLLHPQTQTDTAHPSKLKQWMSECWSRMPVAMSNSLGGKLRGYISL